MKYYRNTTSGFYKVIPLTIEVRYFLGLGKLQSMNTAFTNFPLELHVKLVKAVFRFLFLFF